MGRQPGVLDTNRAVVTDGGLDDVPAHLPGFQLELLACFALLQTMAVQADRLGAIGTVALENGFVLVLVVLEHGFPQ